MVKVGWKKEHIEGGTPVRGRSACHMCSLKWRSLLCAALLAATLPGSHGADKGFLPFSVLGSPSDYALEEENRQVWFEKLHGAWPLPKVYPGGWPRTETAEWAHRMEQHEAWVRNQNDRMVQWQLWLDLAQMRMLANFTPSGWSHTEIDPDVHREVSALFGDRQVAEHSSEPDEDWVLVGDRDLWDFNQHLPPALYRKLIESIRQKLAEWVDLRTDQIKESNAYGVRIYKRGSVLKSHVDHLETHVLSAVYCVDIQGEDKGAEPWHLGAFPDFTGKDAKVDLRPGQLFLYESAKLPHARPGVFHGESYAAMFVHFRPVDWDMTRFDRIYAVPPRWEERQRSEP